MGVGTSQALEDLRPGLFPTQLQREILTALFPGSAGSLHGARTHPTQVEHSTGLGVGSKGGELESQCSTQHTLCGLEEGPLFFGSGMPIWKPGVRPAVGRRNP